MIPRVAPRKRGKAVAAVILGWLVVPATASAEFRVFPSLIDVKAKPGKGISGVFNVRLRGERGRRFTLDVQDVVQRPDGSFVVQPPSASPFSASTWVEAGPKAFLGGPGRTQPIEYRILVPAKAEPGDHITSLTLKRLPKGGGTTTAPIEAVSVRLTVRVAGAARPRAEIASLDAPTLSGGSPVTARTIVRNTGNVRLDFGRRHRGSLAFRQGSATKEDLAFDRLLYPGQSRLFEVSVTDAPLLGRLRATASVDAGGEKVERSKSVIVLPWRQIVAVLLLALAALVLLAGRHRRRPRRHAPGASADG